MVASGHSSTGPRSGRQTLIGSEVSIAILLSTWVLIGLLDDLSAALQQAISFIAKVAMDAADCTNGGSATVRGQAIAYQNTPPYWSQCTCII